MASLFYKVKLYLEENSKTWEEEKINIVLQNNSDGAGDFIHTWNVSSLTKPTDEQLNELDNQANSLEALGQVYANRKAEYPSIQDLVVALYDTEDKTAIDSKRAEIKLKYPKPI
jgi:hypothetical protein